MADLRINPTWDPFNSDATTAGEYKRIQTAGYSGTYLDYTAPAAANFPLNTPARYFLYLRFTPYTGDYTTYPMLVKDVTTATTLTRVSGAPSTNQYRVAPSTSKSPAIIELHSGQAGHTIATDYYAISTIIDADGYNNLKNETVTTDGDITVNGASALIGNVQVTGSIVGISTISSNSTITAASYMQWSAARTTAPSNNANAMNANGVYYLVGSAVSNLPDATNKYLVFHFESGVGGEQAQQAIRLDNGALYIRSNSGSGYTSWLLK